ncbi:MAG TPA: ABC transporter ATP-binding protein [Pyrinomonadaceae bacterium]|nr:ABC transporter ATP-binding protein [Pyrinomonadaceae bacterium]
MSKVQSPKSESLCGETNAANPASPTEASDDNGARAGAADFGPGTLDFGLAVTDLRKSFSSPAGERIEVLRGASFSVDAGETVAIMGSSGAGKSTLLHLLGGLEEPDHGSILAGKFSIGDAQAKTLAHFRNRRVGFVFQFHHLLPDLSAAENVSLPLLINRMSHQEALRLATRALAEVGLGERISHPAAHLSGGEQQRVAVCRALISRPALVLADEPTGNLDTSIGDEIAQALVSYGRANRAVVIIATHNPALSDLCDRSLVLKDGRLTQRR